MPTDISPDALVIRFSPTTVDGVWKRAVVDYRFHEAYRLSVFADTPRVTEQDEDLHARLLYASELQGISPETNKKYYVCTRAQYLLERGFTFCKDGLADEVAEHYSVDLGDDATRDDAARFLEAFDQTGVRRP